MYKISNAYLSAELIGLLDENVGEKQPKRICIFLYFTFLSYERF